MKSRRLLGALLAVALTFTTAISLAGCNSSSSNKPEETKPTTVEKDKDQYLNLFLLNPLTLDPNDARNTSEFQIITETQEGLARVFTDKSGNEKLEPAGAEKWEVSKDGLVWTFHIRDHKWSDGKPVTAQQYVDSIIRLLDPEKAFSYALFAYDIKNAEAYYNKKAKAEEVGAKAVDEKTLQITLEKPAPQFEKKLGFVCLFPIRLDVIKAGGETWATDHTKHVFNGPFIIKEWVKEHSIVLEKNPNYWDEKNISLQKVNMTIVDEFSTQAQLFESKQMDVIEAQQEYSAKWKAMADKGELQYIQSNVPTMSFVGFNQKTNGASGMMGNAKIRKALSLSIDREEFANTLYGKNYPGYGLIPKGISIGNDEFRAVHKEALKAEYDQYKGNKEKLQGLFKEGLKELGKSEDISQVKLIFITTGSSALSKSTQEYWKQTWENKLGIKIDMQVFGDSKTFAAARNAGQYDILTNGWHGDYNDPMTFADLWITNSGFAKFFGGYGSKEYDELFKKLDGEADLKKRDALYAELENQLVVKDAGIAPYMYEDSRNFVHNYVKNLSIPMFGPPIEFSRAYTAGR